jgi:PAS domain S-box-containing protein
MYRRLVEESSDVTAVVRPDGTVTYVSPAVEGTLGYDPEEVLGDDGSEYVHPGDREAVVDAVEALRADPDQPQTVEARLRRPDGSWSRVETVMHDRTSDDVVDGILVTARPLDRREDREEDLAATKERMELALEGANLGIWDWDMRTDRVTRDELLTEMLGYTQSEMGDRLDGWERVVHPEDQRRHDEALAKHVADRTPYYQCDHRLKTNSGEWKWVRTMGTVVERDADGTPVRAVGIHQDIDDRKRAQLALKEERDLFREGPAVVFKWVDAEGWPIEYVSENVEEVLGYPPEKLRSTDVQFADLVHEADLDRVRREVAEHERRESDYLSLDPYRVVTAAGETRWVLEHTTYVGDGVEPSHLLGYLVDVTERKRREQELREREEKYRSLFEDTRDALMVFDREGYLDCNERTLDLFGIDSVEEFLGYTPWELSPETQPDGSDSRAAALEHVETAFEAGGAFFEWTHQRADGTVFPSEVKLSRFEHDGEQALHALIRDITDRKAQERQLREREQKYRRLFEDSRDALMLLDRNGFFDCNERALELFGIDSVEAFVEYAPWDLSPETQPDGSDSRAAALEHVETAFAEGEAFFEWTHRRADGTTFLAEVKLSRFEHDGQRALHAIVRDITARKEYEQRLEEQRDNLDVLNQVLRHDIRNDIQLITAYAELLADECDDETELEYIETVMENASHAVELTVSAREMAEVMLSAREELHDVDLRSVLEAELDEVRSSYSEAVVAFGTDVPPVTVRADDMLDSVFRNVLKNAVQHNDREVPEVTVTVGDRKETVRVRIADNGPGIPDGQKDDIFGKGEKGLDSQGTGIGLYLVKTLVESYGGDIWVEDREPGADAGGADADRGAVFVVELPKADG